LNYVFLALLIVIVALLLIVINKLSDAHVSDSFDLVEYEEPSALSRVAKKVKRRTEEIQKLTEEEMKEDELKNDFYD